MSQIKELREKAARARTQAKEILDAIPANASAEVRTEANVKAEAAFKDADAFDASADSFERIEAEDRRAAARDERSRESRRPDSPARQDEQRGDAPALDYTEAFRQLILARGEVHELAPEARALLRNGYRALESRAQTAGTNTAGGYTVPVTLAAALEKAMLAYGPMFNSDIVTVLTDTSGNPWTMPTIDDNSKTGSAKAEGADLGTTAGSDAVFGQARLDGYTFSIPDIIRISVELAQDSILPVQAVLEMLLGERLGRLANAQCTTGTGSSAPNGIVTASGLGKTTASATAVTADEILQFYHSVDPAYRAQPKFRAMFNDDTLLKIRLLKDGQGNYLIRESADFAGQIVVGSVRVPYSINQAMASIATGNKFMVMGDFSKYLVRKIGGVNVGILKEKFWPDIGMSAFIRFDADTINAAAIKHMKNA